jgi:hypothetical protein
MQTSRQLKTAVRVIFHKEESEIIALTNGSTSMNLHKPVTDLKNLSVSNEDRPTSFIRRVVDGENEKVA